MYSLKKAFRELNIHIDKFFANNLEMTQSIADASVYMKCKNGRIALVAIYVHDLLVASDCIDTLIETEDLLSTLFEMKDLR